MTENEQAEAVWQIAIAMPAVAELIAKDARENLGGTEVVSVGSVFAREIQGVQCYLVGGHTAQTSTPLNNSSPSSKHFYAK
jgi:hypothetical protein